MALLGLSDDAAFYAWAAATWSVTATLAVDIARGWARGRRFRVTDVFTPFRVAALLVCALSSQISLRLYAVRVVIPEARRWRGGQDAVGVEAAVERVFSEEPYFWPAFGCIFCVGFIANFVVAGARRRAPAPPPPRAAAAAQRAAGSARVPLLEGVLFLALGWLCVCTVPILVLSYMAATANGTDAAAA